MMRLKIRTVFASAALLILCVFCMQPTAYATATLLPTEAETAVTVTEVATEIGYNYVRYPQLDGMKNSALQKTINDEIVTEAHIVQHLATLGTLQQGGAGLQVSDTAYLNDGLLSVVVSAKGMMENFRNGQQYTALAYDLNTGARLTLSDFFADPAAATAWMEEQLLDGYADELSLYLEYADVTPLPVSSFSFDESGITFYYPYRQFSFLSGYCGSVQFQYGELQDFLIRNAESVPDRLGALLPQYGDAEIKEKIEAIAAQGTLPYLPVKLGDSLSDLIQAYRLVRTPDQYPGGRYFQFDAAPFRGVLILSDALLTSYDHSVVEGILATRMNLFGLQTGVTVRDRWLQILGEPSASVYLDESISADYGLPPGTADYFAVSDRQLMLYADENNILYAVRLTK